MPDQLSSQQPMSLPPSSPWTLDTLKVVLEAEIQSLDKVTTSRFLSGDKSTSEAQEAIKVGLANAQRALDAAAVLAKDAVGEAKIAHAAEHTAQAMALSIFTLELKEKLGEMNMFRAQLTTERSEFATRDRLTSAIGTVEGVIAVATSTWTAAMTLQDTRINNTITDVTRNTSRLDQKDGDDRRRDESQTAMSKQLSELEAQYNNMQSRFFGFVAALTAFLVVFELFWKYIVK